MTTKVPPVILAIDTPEISVAQQWLSATAGLISGYKLGLEFFSRHGAVGVSEVQKSSEADLFLDLKLHDIPNTVGSAVEQLTHLNPRFLTVHASGGTSMIQSAVAHAPHIEITAVTILTSLSEADVAKLGFAHSPLESAVTLATVAAQAGAKAIVCSPLEISAIRAAVGPNIHIITPGVRPSSAAKDDQARTMDPASAIRAGANYLVIGRPITRAWADGAVAMRAAALSISQELGFEG